ncbi:DUF2155 domain-containing protein [Candidatus Puniceispirillum sp.]|nr:DUF2155 domain-containing protein [Candidatus Puniceispirillum sp.]
MPQVMRQPATIWSAIHAKYGHIGAGWRCAMLVAIACLWPFLASSFLVGAAGATTWIDGNKARLQALDKITARISTVEAPVGAPRFYGTLEITINRCAFHPPEEPPENAAFITVRDRGYDGLAPKQVFSGWFFSSSPAVSALEHPVYDLTLLACFND